MMSFKVISGSQRSSFSTSRVMSLSDLMVFPLTCKYRHQRTDQNRVNHLERRGLFAPSVGSTARFGGRPGMFLGAASATSPN
jgi:hypothetical protein